MFILKAHVHKYCYKVQFFNPVKKKELLKVADEEAVVCHQFYAAVLWS